MAYKPGVALAASITLIICSVILFGLYFACGTCFGITVSYGSPLWTGAPALFTGLCGVSMSTTKSEKGCGPFFLALSIICIFTSLACMGLSIYASLYGLSFYDERNFYLWIAMGGMALVLSIITCVTSCQFCCCCQETQPAQEVVIFYQGGEQVQQQPQQQVRPQIFILSPVASPGGQCVQQGYPQVLNQPIGGAPGQPWHQPPSNPAQPYSQNQYLVAPSQPQPSAPPPPYQEQITEANQIRPVTTGQNQTHAVQPTKAPYAQPQSIYQPLLNQNNQTSTSQIQKTYFETEQAQQGVRGPLHQQSGTPSDQTYAYAQTIEQSDPEVIANNSYLEPIAKGSSFPPENPASGIGSGAMYAIEKPSYDYAAPEVAGHSQQYINDRLAKRPKAKEPK